MRVRVGLEPEPGCIVETTDQAAAALRDVDHDWVGVCLDACHLAVQFEEPGDLGRRARRRRRAGREGSGVERAADGGPALSGRGRHARRLRRAPLPPPDPRAPERRRHRSRRSRRGARRRPARRRRSGGSTSTCRSTPSGRRRRRSRELRRRSQRSSAARRRGTRHLEVETYTWTVLPPDRRPADDAGLVAGARRTSWSGPASGCMELGLEEVMMKTRLLVLDIVGMTPKLLEPHAERSRRWRRNGFQAELGTVLPAVTCTVQSTILTGLPPSEHGIVGNGWYFRELGEVFLWRQHNALVQGEKIWETARRADPELQSREPLLVVRDGRDDRPDADAAPDLPRRRPQVAGLLHGAACAPRRARRRSSARSPSSSTGARRASIASSEWIGRRGRTRPAPRAAAS